MLPAQPTKLATRSRSTTPERAAAERMLAAVRPTAAVSGSARGSGRMETPVPASIRALVMERQRVRALVPLVAQLEAPNPPQRPGRAQALTRGLDQVPVPAPGSAPAPALRAELPRELARVKLARAWEPVQLLISVRELGRASVPERAQEPDWAAARLLTSVPARAQASVPGPEPAPASEPGLERMQVSELAALPARPPVRGLQPVVLAPARLVALGLA